MRAHGFEVIARNLRLGYLEVDVLARKGPVVVLVEVRTRGRGSYLTAFESVSAVKRRRLRRAAQMIWRRMRGDLTIDRVRIDCIAVDLTTTPVTVEYARAIR